MPLTENGELRAVQEMLTTGRSAQLQFIVGMKEARLMNRKPEDARRYVAGKGLVPLFNQCHLLCYFLPQIMQLQVPPLSSGNPT